MTPTYAISPRRQRAFFIYLLIGLLVGIGIAVAVERLDDSVRSPLELSEKYSLPVLGMIPAIRSGELSEAPVSAGVSRIVTHADPRSPVAEAYRSLRTNLAFARTQRGLRAVALTSPGPADGKSTTVANLAITFAQQGQRTLLVDADLRRAVLDKSFGIPRSPGLTEVIIGASGFDQAVHETQVPNLFVMTSGQLPPNPSELLGSPAMREVLATMTSQFDMVLFDSPPLLAVTDAAVLSTMVDGTILIARMGATARKGLWRAVSQLRAVHATLLGSVLNDVTSDVGAYYGGYSYYYYYSSHADGSVNGLPAGILARLKRLTSGVTGAGPKWG
jgi:polysaccharide biosynthesis transport protein